MLQEMVWSFQSAASLVQDISLKESETKEVWQFVCYIIYRIIGLITPKICRFCRLGTCCRQKTPEFLGSIIAGNLSITEQVYDVLTRSSHWNEIILKSQVCGPTVAGRQLGGILFIYRHAYTCLGRILTCLWKITESTSHRESIIISLIEKPPSVSLQCSTTNILPPFIH